MAEPRCPVFGKCGGCSYQDKDYDFQLSLKRKTMEDAFCTHRIEIPAGLKVYFKDEYYYRNRMDFAMSPDGPGQRYRGRFGKIISFEKCYIANERVNRLLAEFREWFLSNKAAISVFDPVKRKGALRYATMRASLYSGDTSITFILNSDSDSLKEHVEMLEKFTASCSAANVLYGFVKHNSDQSVVQEYTVIKGSDIIMERLAGMELYYHSQGFFQNNSAAVTDILIFAQDYIPAGVRVFDLFGGAGTFGIFASKKAGEIIIADNSPLNIRCAIKNIEANKVTNAKAVNSDEKDFAALGITGADTVILDPPRPGLHKKTIAGLLSCVPGRIIYISCNPESLARDIAGLSEKYTVTAAAMFDMFPQTRHMEAAAVLDIKK
ncbi:MAG TPA: 23S rRNA (uracil(1939)-C(5))-methyltransferase RlmD [Firmicutes bacterium]|nr:23S rRNA (uracil(1939)-C(5))-methyltransferase RlmD [Bacillota bacterium]